MSSLKIHEAIELGDLNLLSRILQNRPDAINDLDDFGDQPLHTACRYKQVGSLGILLNYHPDLNSIGDLGRSPLHCAVHEGDILSAAIVKILIDEGADPTVRDGAGFTPAGWAKVEMDDGLKEVLQILEPARGR